jgi:hypothetical protein
MLFFHTKDMQSLYDSFHVLRSAFVTNEEGDVDNAETWLRIVEALHDLGFKKASTALYLEARAIAEKIRSEKMRLKKEGYNFGAIYLGRWEQAVLAPLLSERERRWYYTPQNHPEPMGTRVIRDDSVPHRVLATTKEHLAVLDGR